LPADSRFQRRLFLTVGVVSAAVLLLAGAWAARAALILIYISALLAVGLAPVVQFIERRVRVGRRRLPRSLAILSVYLVLAVLAGLFASIVVPPLIEQASALQQKLPGMFRHAQQFLISRGIIARPVTIEQAVTASSQPEAASTVVAVASSAIAGAAGGIAGFITILFLTFYLLLEGPAILDRLWSTVPEPRRPAVREMSRLIVDRISAWLGANVLLGVVMGSVSALVLGLAGEPYFYVVALVAAIGEAVPVAGSIMAGTLAVIVATTVSLKLALIVAVLFFVLHEIEANVLVPRLMQRRLGVSSAALIIALVIGWEWLGVLGIVLALPTTAVIAAVVEAMSPEHRGHAARSGIYRNEDRHC
jgi:predicted PurR-regulated permease PerM